jgi:hypothetical protein
VQIAQGFPSGPCSPAPVTSKRTRGRHQTMHGCCSWPCETWVHDKSNGSCLAGCILNHKFFWTASSGETEGARKKKYLVVLFRWIHASLHHHSHGENTEMSSSGTLVASPIKENTKKEDLTILYKGFLDTLMSHRLLCSSTESIRGELRPS